MLLLLLQPVLQPAAPPPEPPPVNGPSGGLSWLRGRSAPFDYSPAPALQAPPSARPRSARRNDILLLTAKV